MTYVGRPHDPPDLLHGIEIWGQTPMHSENLLVNDGSNWETIKTIREGFPQLYVVSSLTLVVKAIYTVDGGTLVVAAKNEEIFGILDLVGQEETNGLQRLFASINVIAEEEIVSFWGEAAVLKQSKEIVVLTVNIPTNLYVKIMY